MFNDFICLNEKQTFIDIYFIQSLLSFIQMHYIILLTDHETEN